jgi:hypothetical protein
MMEGSGSVGSVPLTNGSGWTKRQKLTDPEHWALELTRVSVCITFQISLNMLDWPEPAIYSTVPYVTLHCRYYFSQKGYLKMICARDKENKKKTVKIVAPQ